MTTEHLKTFKVAIAGSTDDGKSTLLGRLLIDSDNVPHDQLEAISAESQRLGRPMPEIAWLTDGLSTEQAKLITIDVAYRTIRWKGWRMQLIDTPGHLEYLQNTATGLSQADALVLLLDVSRDFTVQTLRHLQLAKMFAISHIAIVVNKMDTVDYSCQSFEVCVSRFRNFASSLMPDSVLIIPVSALHGHNVVKNHNLTPWYKGPTLLEYLQHLADTGASSIFKTESSSLSIAKIFWASRFPPRAGIKVITGKIETENDYYIPNKNNQKVRVKEIHYIGNPVKTLGPGQSAVLTTEAQVSLKPDWILIDTPLKPAVIRVQTDGLQLLPFTSHLKYHWITPLGTYPIRIIKTSISQPQSTQGTEYPKFVSAVLEFTFFDEVPFQLFQRGLLVDSEGKLVAITGSVHLI
ncbi:MAG: GTP-binding protein [Thermaurantimonas sp.]|uniref:GTP-binding protein n=1 Tax=Thermaurantimonas sp. TaxID=2681568 RepID=UPI00391975D3